MLRASISRITTVVCRVTGQRYDEVSQVVDFSNKGVPRLHLANSCVCMAGFGIDFAHILRISCCFFVFFFKRAGHVRSQIITQHLNNSPDWPKVLRRD